VVKAQYWDPDSDSMQELMLSDLSEFTQVLGEVARFTPLRGRPAILLTNEQGSQLGFASSDEHAFLVWIDSLGESYTSDGDGDHEDLVFDYMGSWSEAPGTSLVSLEAGLESVMSFLDSGSPVTPRVLFIPD